MAVLTAWMASAEPEEDAAVAAAKAAPAADMEAERAADAAVWRLWQISGRRQRCGGLTQRRL